MTEKILPILTNTAFLAEAAGPSVRAGRPNRAHRESDAVISVDVRIKHTSEPHMPASKQHVVPPTIEDGPMGLIIDVYV